jgi:predicted  nucleic acid-binding Zn ribbon protein
MVTVTIPATRVRGERTHEPNTRTCTRCGIDYRHGHNQYDTCRDCRSVAKVKPRR